MLAATTTEDDLQNFVEVLAEETQKKRRKINSKPDNNTGVVYMEPLADCGEYQKICDMMSHCGGNATKAAALLGISRVTLWRKLKKYHALRNPMELS